MEIKIEPYCENCPEFEPVCTTSCFYSNDDEYTKLIQRVIYCKHNKRCKNLVRYLKNQIDKEEVE